jgi:hypothetical protein
VLTVLGVSCLVLASSTTAGEGADPPTRAAWELRALGVPEGERVEALRRSGSRRSVTMAIVGQGGVSKARLRRLLGEENTLKYRERAKDPGSNTHDTGMARVILDLTSRLGVRVRLLVYHPGAPFRDVAKQMRMAGKEADIVVFFQSFWGPDVTYITEAIRQAQGCLFVSPYVQYKRLPTGGCPQAHSAKPWADGCPNFVTAAPLAFKAPGRLLSPSSRDADTEVINFIAPSYYASGPGGTCPAAAVTAAVAAYVIAASETKPSPEDAVQLMRETVTRDQASLKSALGYDDDTMKRLRTQLAFLADPKGGAKRKLDATGVLNLWSIHQRIGSAEGPTQ